MTSELNKNSEASQIENPIETIEIKTIFSPIKVKPISILIESPKNPKATSDDESSDEENNENVISKVVLKDNKLFIKPFRCPVKSCKQVRFQNKKFKAILKHCFFFSDFRELEIFRKL